MSFLTNLLVNEGIALANPLIISEEELELQKLYASNPLVYKLVIEAITLLNKELASQITGDSLGAKAARAFFADLQTGASASAAANKVAVNDTDPTEGHGHEPLP